MSRRIIWTLALLWACCIAAGVAGWRLGLREARAARDAAQAAEGRARAAEATVDALEAAQARVRRTDDTTKREIDEIDLQPAGAARLDAPLRGAWRSGLGRVRAAAEDRPGGSSESSRGVSRP